MENYTPTIITGEQQQDDEIFAKIPAFDADGQAGHVTLPSGDGSVIIMELLKYFAEHKPARTLKFNWYGSEEQGLLGSKAWTAAHADELDKHVLMVNVQHLIQRLLKVL